MAEMEFTSRVHVVVESMSPEVDSKNTVVEKGSPFLVEWQHATPPLSSEKWPREVSSFEMIISHPPEAGSWFEKTIKRLDHVPILRGRRIEVMVEVQQSAALRHVLHHPQAQLSDEFVQPIHRLIADSLEVEQATFPLDLRQSAFVPCNFLSTIDPTPIHPSPTVCLYYSIDDLFALLSDLPIVRRSKPKYATSGRGLYLHVQTDRQGGRVSGWVGVDRAETQLVREDFESEGTQITQLSFGKQQSQLRRAVFNNRVWETSEVTPPSGLSAQVGRWVDKTGLHRMLHTDIVMTTRQGTPTECRVCVVESLPSAIYADLNEIRTIGHPHVAAYRDIDVELPSFLSSQHTVLVYSDWSKPSTSTDTMWSFNVSLPIHLRYQHPSDTALYGNATLGVPGIFYQCRQSNADQIDQSNARPGSFYRPGQIDNSDWSVPISIDHLIGRPGEQSASSQPIVLQVPVGQMGDYGLVTAGTLLVTYAICFYVLWVTCSGGSAANQKTGTSNPRKLMANDMKDKAE